MKSFSIIIPAFNSQEFIEECLDSIKNQTFFKDNDSYEILLGIDSCDETYKKVESIKHKYKNLRVFMMDKNVGPYVVKNTLIPLVKYDNILFFDSDDIMHSDMIYEIYKLINDADYIRYNCMTFKHGEDKNINIISNRPPEGVFYCNKKLLSKLVGFIPWRCAADTEFVNRFRNTGLKLKTIKKPLFYRRNHPNSLCNNINTDFKSKTRREYAKEIRVRRSSSITKIKLETISYKEVT